jgi:uridylate kinase
VAGSLIRRATADWMGMLATVMNGLALRDALESRGLPALLLSSVPVAGVCDPWSGRSCREALATGKVAILAGGTGNPHVTTDSAAALRAVEIEADVLLKATKVDGIYSGDPRTCPDAVRYDRLTYEEFLEKKLRALDLAAVALCMDNRMPVVLFNMFESGNIESALRGEVEGTTLVAGT